MTLKYATTNELAQVMNIKGTIPLFVVGETPVKETIGTATGVTATLYFDHNNIIADTYTIYTGATESAATALTETTNYSVNKDDGSITLYPSAGTSTIYAKYAYCNVDIPDSFLSDTLYRAEAQVDSMLNTSFTDGSVTNPNYPYSIEYQPSQGVFNRSYFTKNRPLIDISSKLGTAVTSTGTAVTITTNSGDLFPTSGTIIIGSEVITYTGTTASTLTGLTRGCNDSSAVAHSSGDSVHTTVVEVSGDGEGSSPTWYPLAWDSEVVADENGKVYIYGDTLLNTNIVTNALLPKQDVANRFKITYLYGHNTIPKDIKRLTLLCAMKQLFTDTIIGSLFKGRNEFKPELIASVDNEIASIVSTYEVVNCYNT